MAEPYLFSVQRNGIHVMVVVVIPFNWITVYVCVCVCVDACAYIDWNDTIDRFYEMCPSNVSWLANATGSQNDDGLSCVYRRNYLSYSSSNKIRTPKTSAKPLQAI